MPLPKCAVHPELNPGELRWKCDPSIFDFDSTDSIEPIEGILGQERALKAIRLGVDLRKPGYNIYIAGLSGTGKATTVKKMLEHISSNCPALYDYAYVNNFKDEDRPVLLTFPVGQARAFKQEMQSTIDMLKVKIPQTLESETNTNRKKKIISQYNEREQAILSSFEEKLGSDNFTLGQVKIGDAARPDIFPVVDQKAIPVYQLEEQVVANKISKEDAQEILKKYNNYQQELQIIFRKGLKLSQEFQQKLFKLERDSVGVVVKGIIENLKEKFNDKKILTFLFDVEEHILNNIQVFKGVKPDHEPAAEGFIIDYFKEYDVNVILDNSETSECPVVVETNPTYTNIFGTVEKINDGRGGFYTDFTKIKSGSLLRANGGYLVLNVNHLFEEQGVWRMLKRVLTYRKLEIQDPPGLLQLSPSTLKPEPIDIDTKIILIGSQYIYSVLSEHEYDFKKIFKVKADFDYEIKHSPEILIQYARVVKKLIKDENLCEFSRNAMAYLIEISAKYAGQKNKLTLRFSQIADLAREASFWAKEEAECMVTEAHVKKAYDFAVERHGMLESKISDMFSDEMILIDTDGERTGQINGLAVYGADFYSFGRPTRITATVSLGSGSIINVEREAGMSGRHYNKGVLIISGYFRETFGQDMPLSFNANLVFEQSYGTVDGDSASCAEIYALLSTLSGLPLKQSLAVTGSLNQKGDVQPIGGVNEKIEGFFDVCESRGLTGEQGVIIPVQNVKELMLKDEVIEAVSQKKFHIYPVARVEEGIELLTGVKAGEKTKEGYEADSVFYLVEKKIKDLYAKSRSIRPAANGENQPKTKKTVKKVVKKKRNNTK
jgi:ATP-dependent Lon protease